MSDTKVDPLTGRHVAIVGNRQARPNLPAADHCPFCVGGIEAPEPYETRWFENRWPPLPDGRAQVLLYSPDHDASMATLSPLQARAVVDLWADRTHALGARDDVAYVLLFENRGPEVGATIRHPHGQVYAFDEVPPAVQRELANDACVLCEEEPGDRLVAELGDWRAWIPALAGWPYELVLAPTRHVPGIPALDDGSRNALAGILVDVVATLDAHFDAETPLMLWVHQQPCDGAEWPTAHVHVHITPIWRSRNVPRFVAAAELGSDLWFNPVRPQDAAADLRDARR
ncbi:MAG: UDPglucose--hexose-phosphate uridylyltransferase [Actinomycetota bacterium]